MADFPNINGTAYSWASISIVIHHDGGQFETGDICAIDYEDTLEPGAVRGAGAKKRGRTLGEYNATGKLGLYKDAAHRFMAALAALNPSIGRVVFDITVAYQTDPNDPDSIVTDEIIGCRITSRPQSGAPGSDPSKIEFALDVMNLKLGGVELLAADE